MFESLGLFNELEDATDLALFLDAFLDAEHLENGEILLEMPQPEAEKDTKPNKACQLTPDFIPNVPFVFPGQPPVQSVLSCSHAAHVNPSCTQGSLSARIAVVAPFGGLTVAAPVPDCIADPRARLESSKKTYRQEAIARWHEKRKRRAFGASQQRFPEYECRRRVATRRPRVNGRFIREQPVYVSVTELQQSTAV